MKVNGPVIAATQPDPVNVFRVIDYIDCVVLEIDINRPKRPEVWTTAMPGDDGNWTVQVRCLPSDGTPHSQRSEYVMLSIEVTECANLQVIRDSGRYTVTLVLIDRALAGES